MDWQETLFRIVTPSMAGGMTFGDWMRLLAQNSFRVHPRYWSRAAFGTLFSLTNTPLCWLENGIYGRRVAAETVHPPLFVLGHARSGTTHLQNLLAIDSRFAYLKLSQAAAPQTFLLTERVVRAVGSLLLPRTRQPVDNVSFGPDVPFEEEFALCFMTSLSPYLMWAFPARMDHYERYLTFRGVPDQEVERWKTAFLTLVKKLTLRYNRPLMFRSPPNTCRIKLLLDTFPDARFVHIHRNPYAVYQSTKRLLATHWKYHTFQRLDFTKLHEHVIRQYKAMYEAFFEEKALIPEGRYSQVAFEELEDDPVGQLRRVYEELGLPDFAVVQPQLEEYVVSLAGFMKNVYPELSAEVRSEIAQAWRRCFDEWEYPIEVQSH